VTEPDDDRLRRTFVRVMSVQAITLVLLWLLQQRFGR
jgi:hypothetical protein